MLFVINASEVYANTEVSPNYGSALASLIHGLSGGGTTTKTTSTIKPSTSTKPTTTATPTCQPGAYGLKNGDVFKGACCKTEADRLNDCINKQCDGPANPSVTTTTTASISTPTSSPSRCPVNNSACPVNGRYACSGNSSATCINNIEYFRNVPVALPVTLLLMEHLFIVLKVPVVYVP